MLIASWVVRTVPLLLCNVFGLSTQASIELDAKLRELELPELVIEAVHEYARSVGDAELPTSCPHVQTDHSLDAKRLLGYWNVLGTRHPALEETFDCPMMNITEGGVVGKHGHNTEHYEAYFQGLHVKFKGDEYAPDPAEPGKKLFSVFCALGHCGLYIPYWWIETDADYDYASVYYCWPALPLLRGYLVTSRFAARPPLNVETRFLANVTRMGLVKDGTQLRWRDDRPCWNRLATDVFV